MSQSDLGRVTEIWRYPVMGLGGEMLRQAYLGVGGVRGDREYIVRDLSTGRVMDPKVIEYAWGETGALPSMLDVSASLSGDDGARRLSLSEGGVVVSSSTPEDSGSALTSLLGHSVGVQAYPRVVEARTRSGRALHIVTDASLASLKGFYPQGVFDVRRFRPNVLVDTGGRKGFVEEEWVGRTVKLGDGPEVTVGKPNIRCEITNMRQGPLPEDPGILKTVGEKNGKRLGVLCTVLKEGAFSVGDRVVAV